MRAATVPLGAAVLALFAAGPATAKDYSSTALNIIPSGQYGSVPPVPGADTQALMYDALTPLFDNVTDADLMSKFKSESFGLGEDGFVRLGCAAYTSDEEVERVIAALAELAG